MRNILITGASGFTGRTLAARLNEELDVQIHLTSRKEPKSIQCAWKTFSPCDFSDLRVVRAVLKETKPDWIFHLAGALKGNASELFQANVQNAVNLLEAASEIVPAARVLLIGSAAEYGNPLRDGPISESHPCHPNGAYGVSKYAATLAGLDFAKRGKPRVNIARAFNLIGPGIPSTLLLGAVIERARKAIENDLPSISLGDISTERDFIDVRDAVEAYLMIMKSDANGEVFNVCGGVGTVLSDLVHAALKTAPRALLCVFDSKLGSAGAKSVVGNPDKLRSLGFQARFSLQQSIKDSCEPLRAK
jgi:GDP-4-dehydro-6-deoxy-D-mannose reductase